MKSYTWEEIAKAKEAEKKLIVETHGLLGAVAIEVARSEKGRPEGKVEDCAVFKFLKASLDSGEWDSSFPCMKCPLKKDPCDYSYLGRKNLIRWYDKMYKKARGKKK